MFTAYFIAATLMFFLLYWKWGVDNKVNLLMKILLLILSLTGFYCALFSFGILHR